MIGGLPRSFRSEYTGMTVGLAETVRRVYVSNAAGMLFSGTLHLTAIYLEGGLTVSSLSFISGTTAANGPTNWWFALYDGDLNLMAQSPDQLTAAWAANTLKKLSFGTPVTLSKSGIYYVGVMVAASVQVPSLIAAVSHANVTTLTPRLAGLANTGLTTTAPAVATFSSTSGNMAYCIVE